MITSLSIENVAGELDFLVCIQNGCNAQVLCGFGVAVGCGMIRFSKSRGKSRTTGD